MDKYIDLHLHLDGAVTPAIARGLAAVQGIRLPSDDEKELSRLLTVRPECTSLNDFLKCFALPVSLMQTPEGLSEAVRLVCDNIMSQGVIYAELRFAPQLHTQKGMTQEEAVLAAVSGLKKTRLKANLILCFMRGSDNMDRNYETLEVATKHIVPDGGAVAVDLAGAEALYPTSDYKALFDEVRRRKLPYTIHAGEADGPQSVRSAIEFGTKRIGHGVRSFEDPEVVNMIREKGIFLEMCPTSNRQTHAIPDMSKYPLVDFVRSGIRVTVNTDDMGVEGTTLADEFRYLKQTFGLTEDEAKITLRNSVEAAFTTDQVRKDLLKTLGL